MLIATMGPRSQTLVNPTKTSVVFHYSFDKPKNARIIEEKSSAAQQTKKRYSPYVQKHFCRNDVPTLGEKLKKSIRFARDVLRFAAFFARL